ncbi:MAG: ABC transporter permease [Rhodobacteraceae bacterium]|nr:ABC transporter permease [Paracoccaceae bacterium]
MPMLAGGAVMVALVLVAILAGQITGDQPFRISPRERYVAPGALHWFGTDGLGRDLFRMVVHGGRISLTVGALVALVSAAIGTAMGLAAGYIRLLDPVLMRVADGMMAIPGILFAIALVALFGASLTTLVAAIAFSDIAPVARLIRSVVLGTREEPYVRAAEGLGLPVWRVMLRHVLPSCIAPLVVQMTFIFASAILTEAILGFLGVGFPPTVPTWGNVLAEGRGAFQLAPWTILAPGLFLALAVIAVNLFGDGLRDFLDPHMRRRGGR